MINSYFIKRLVLNNYRSYEKLRIDTNLSKNIIITGENGAGKTNILEAISMLSQSGPFRKAKLSQLGKTNANISVFTISSQIESDDDVFNLGLSYNYTDKQNISDDDDIVEKRQIIANDDNITVGDLQNYIRVIWITPFMDRLFSEATGERRKFLDNLISNFYPFYGVSLNQYSNLLKQRAKVLKSHNVDEKWLDAIESEIVEKGVSIAALRIEFEEKLNNILKTSDNVFPKIQIHIDGAIEEKLKTLKSVEVEDFYKKSLLDNRELFKFTFSPPVEGVHRSDFSAINLDKNMPADQTSTGEQKLAVISIILAYANMLYLYFNKYPLILIDEAPAHLDEIKTLELFKELEKLPTQVWMTGILRSDFEFFENKSSLFIEIENSQIK
ncbi:MAG: AAA family ATPase [Alphaproteobacteria bacterium]|nr:AAA family ATPase [Alphaproteobacteria bacterium]